MTAPNRFELAVVEAAAVQRRSYVGLRGLGAGDYGGALEMALMIAGGGAVLAGGATAYFTRSPVASVGAAVVGGAAAIALARPLVDAWRTHTTPVLV